MYRKSFNEGACLVALMDTNRNVMAAFCSESLHMSGHAHFGNGECFVASVFPHVAVHHWPATANAQFVICNDAFLAFGGDGFALWVDAGLERGTSEACATFATPGSLTLQESFKIVAIEVWGFASPSYRANLGRSAFNSIVSRMALKPEV
jgi:hypothetical protein